MVRKGKGFKNDGDGKKKQNKGMQFASRNVNAPKANPNAYIVKGQVIRSGISLSI